MSKCTGGIEVSGYWEDDVIENPFTGELEYDPEWIDGYYECPTVDLDLHRYQCTHCGEIKYYSQAAREYYENGKLSNIEGLDK